MKFMGIGCQFAHENRFHPVMELNLLEVSGDVVRREVHGTQPWAGFGL